MKTNPNDYINPQENRTSQYSETPNTLIEGGLTKREYFASMTIKGILDAGYDNDYVIKRSKEFVEAAVVVADALIEELNKEK